MQMIKMFKAQCRTHRFRENQRVWVSHECANHLWLVYKFRGKGRYVQGIIDKFHKSVGDIKEFEVDSKFAKMIECKSIGGRISM